MWRFLRARVAEWCLMGLAFALGAIVLPAMLSDAPTEDSAYYGIWLLAVFMGVYVIGDLIVRIAFFVVSPIDMKNYGETIRKH